MDDECAENHPAEHVPADAARKARRVPTRHQAQPSPRPTSNSHARARASTKPSPRPPLIHFACLRPPFSQQVDGRSAEDNSAEDVLADAVRNAHLNHNPNTPTHWHLPIP